MNRNIKTLTKILMIILIAVSILLLLPKTVSAQRVEIDDRNTTEVIYSNDSNDMMTIKDIVDDGKWVYVNYTPLGSGYKQNPFCTPWALCCQSGQLLVGPLPKQDHYSYVHVEREYTINKDSVVNNKTGEIKTDKNTVNFAKGLAYILSQTDKSNDNCYSSKIQLALWEYLFMCYNGQYSGLNCADAISFFGFHNQGGIGVDDYGQPFYNGGTVNFDSTTISNALAIYNQAKTYAENGAINASAKIYILAHVDNQEILVFEWAETTEEAPVQVPLKINKQAFGGTNLNSSAVKFTFTAKENVEKIVGSFPNITVTPKDKSNHTFKIGVTETTAPSGYKKFPGEIILTVQYKDDGTVSSIKSSNTTFIPNTTSKNITVYNRKEKVTLTFNKKDFNGNDLTGAKVTVTKGTGVEKLNKTELTIGSDTLVVYPNDAIVSGNRGTFKITLTETGAPTGYTKFPNPITLTVTYHQGTGNVISISSNNTTYVPNTSNSTVTIKNKPVANLTLHKVDSLTGTGIQGVKFTVKFTNVASIDGFVMQNNQTTYTISITTDANGDINIKGITPADVSKPIEAEITEVSIPSGTGYYYNKLTNPIKVKLEYQTDKTYKYTVTYDGPESDVLGTTTGKTPANHNLTVTIKNQPLITLDGVVWLDEAHGTKNIEPANGILDSGENGLGGILVELHDKSGNIVKTTITDRDGKYEFRDVPKTSAGNGYSIIFKYNGIDYIETKARNENAGSYNAKHYETYGTDSVADEINREEFNNRFATISGTPEKNNGSNTYGVATSRDGSQTTNLYYKSNQDGSGVASASSTYKSELQDTIDGGNKANVSASGEIAKDFEMQAKANNKVNGREETYYTTTSNINCGLVEKTFDLALGSKLQEAIVKVNDSETKYKYEEIPDGDLGSLLQKKSSEEEGEGFWLNIFRSDYNYRINDYKLEEAGGFFNLVNPDDGKTTDYKNLSELEVYIVYDVILYSSEQLDSNVDEFVYYYDPVFKPYSIIDGANEVKFDEKSSVNSGNWTANMSSSGSNKITFTSTNGNNNLNEGNSYRTEVSIKFQVNKDDAGNIIIKEDKIRNIAEITKYSSQTGGFIDNDSAPENAIVNGNTLVARTYEDDTDETKGLTIALTDKTRKISGTVFKDANGDGIYNDGEEIINDVIVQLIEIMEFEGDNNHYEYIWQETRSGSNDVTRSKNGITNVSYKNGVTPGSGQYEFSDFISGKYIVRFIYGDGTTYDLTPNVMEYNGQDYKSTKDANYNSTYYNTTIPTDKTSVARDNEARRLQVMKYSNVIDKNIGTALDVYTNNIAYNDLTNDQKATILDYYNSLIIDEYKNSDKYSLEIKRMREIFNIETGAELPKVESLTEELYNQFKKYVSYKTWMAAETSVVEVDIDTEDVTAVSGINESIYSEVNGTENIDPVEFKDVNLGIAERPETDIVLEKHITGLKITPNGVGVQPIVDAHANIERLLSNDDVLTEGVVTGLAANKSTRETRGFWEVATDVEELMQGAELEVEYTYIVRNEGKQNDYLSNTLVELYKSQDTKSYDSSLDEIINTVKGTMKSGKYGYTADNSNIIGTYLGQYYYTGTVGSRDSVVPTRLETDGLEEAINNAVKFDANYSGEYFKKANGDTVVKTVLDTDGNPKDENIETVIHNASPTAYLTPGSTDYSKKVTLRTVLSSTSGGELGANIPSYIAEAVKYSNAAGRIGNDSAPGNLSYVHSNDNTKTMANSNERDEFWGESIIITKPTGEDKISTMQIAIITVTAVAVLGLGIILIKKFALKK